MKKGLFIVVILLLVNNLWAQSWSLDKAHAKLGFNATHLLISEVEGNFQQFDIKVNAATEDFTDASIELTAEINSINTENEARDKHLKSADFFDAEKYPALTFKSTSLKKVGGKTYKLYGNLTMHGISKPVTLDVILNGVIDHPYSKKKVAGFKVTGTLSRSDFGIGNVPVAVVAEAISINANFELLKD